MQGTRQGGRSGDPPGTIWPGICSAPEGQRKSEAVGQKADILCDGNWVGYNQSDRTGLYNELKKSTGTVEI